MDTGFLRVHRVFVPLGQRVQLMVRAEDADTRMPVPGKVHLLNFDAHGQQEWVEFDTNAPHTAILHRRITRETWGERCLEEPSGVVRAEGYLEANIDFDFQMPPRS